MAGLLDPCPAPLLALAPSGVVTATSTDCSQRPRRCRCRCRCRCRGRDLDVAINRKAGSRCRPKSTAHAPVNPEPEITTDVPPVFAPLDGAKPPTTGGAQVPVEADTPLLLALSQFR
jgi:hypothetical protein